MQSIAFIGVGVMGKSMVQNLAKAGYQISIYTRTKEKVSDIINQDITWYNDIPSCIKDKDIIMTMVGFPKDVEEVYFSDNGILKHAKKDTILIDFTTSSPNLAQEIYQAAKEVNLESLDCPVSGGDIGAKNATLSIMVGGDETTFSKSKPLLEILGTTIHHVGPAGYGQHTKMTNQIALAGAIAGVSEALTYASKVGLDPNIMLECISKGAAGSWQMEHMAPKMLQEDFDPGFYIKHYIKDMTIASKEMQSRETNLIILEQVLSIYQKLQKDGLENEGTQSIIKYYQNN